MSREAILTIEHVSKRFTGVQALDDVQLEVLRGEVHALVGENGAGKSTLMKILTGVHHRDRGTIRFKGEEVELRSPREAQDLGISVIYQEFNLMPHLTVAQNIFVGREPRLKGLPLLDENRLNGEARLILDSLNLGSIRPTTRVSSLSVAKQQMVEIAKAVSTRADLLIMDEPTSALSASEIEDLFRTIRQLKARGVSVIYISHRLEELKEIADRVTVMRDGRYVATMEYAGTTVDRIIGLMVGREITNRFPKAAVVPGEVLLEARGLTRRGVLHDVSFTLRRGEILGLAGLMGSGRTELARALFGADRLDGGEILVAGKAARIGSPLQAIRAGIGYLTEDRKRDGLALGLSVRDNIVLSSVPLFLGRLSVVDDRRTEEAARGFIRALDIRTPSTRQQARFLSGGNQQKVIIARWLCRNTRILLFDEPTRGIDVGAKHEVYELMNRLVADGNAVLMISSELPEILGMSDRILVMHEGRLAGILDRSEATQEKIMFLATGGR